MKKTSRSVLVPLIVAGFLAASSCAGERSPEDNVDGGTKNVTSTTVTTANPPSPSGYSLTYIHSTENGTVVFASDNSTSSSSSSVARSRKKGDLEGEELPPPPAEELPSLPDPPFHSETSTSRSVVPKKGVDSPATLEAESASSSGEHHHSGRIVPKKGVEAGDEDDGGIRNEMATTSEAPAVIEYNVTASGDDGTDGGMKRVVLPPADDTAAVNVPHVAEVPKPKQIPMPSDREQEVKSEPRQEADPSTPDTTLVVGLIFGATLFSVVAFLVFKRVRAAQRRREYRRMNDFLIDGMYNDL